MLTSVKNSSSTELSYHHGVVGSIIKDVCVCMCVCVCIYIYIYIYTHIGPLVAQTVNNLPAMQKTQFDPWVRKIPWINHSMLAGISLILVDESTAHYKTTS